MVPSLFARTVPRFVTFIIFIRSFAPYITSYVDYVTYVPKDPEGTNEVAYVASDRYLRS